MGFYRRLIDNHPLANITFVLVLLGGLLTYLTLPRAQDPEINFNWVNVLTYLPGASAEDVERELTGPLEDAVQRVKDVKFVSSSSREGVSSLLVRFNELSERDFDKRIADLRREVQNKASSELPADATDPYILEISSSNGFPTAILAVYGSGGESLRRAAFSTKKDLERIKGVDQVLAEGMEDPELHVDFDPAALQARGLSPITVSDGVGGWFRNSLAGRVRVEDQEWLVRLEGKTDDAAVLGGAALITEAGRVSVDEVARVSRGHERSDRLVSYNGHPAVMLSVTKQANANTLELVDRLNAFVQERSPVLAGIGVNVVVLDDQTPPTRNAIKVMESNALVGLFIVLLLCWVFLGSSLSMLVGLGVPFALAGTFIAVGMIGSTLNLTVLLGVVIALGMLVDDAVVIVEAIYYRLQRGVPVSQAVFDGVSEVATPVLSSVLTTISAFLPLMLLPGIIGKFMFVVPFVVTVALLVSLVEAFWIMPTHVMALRPRVSGSRSAMQIRRERFTHWLRVAYARGLVRVMRRPKTTLMALLLLICAAAGAVGSGLVKLQFFAFDPMRLFYVNVEMPSGGAPDYTLKRAEEVAAVVQKQLDPAEVRSVTVLAGMKFTDQEPLYGAQYGQVIVSLRPRSEGGRDVSDVVETLREPVMALAGERKLSFLQVSGGPPVAKAISVKIKSDDPGQLRAAADALLATAARIPGIKDLTDDDVPGRNELRLVLNREKLAHTGVKPGDVARLLRLYGEGETIASTRSDGEKLEVVVRAQPGRLTDVAEILQQPVLLPDGRSIALGSVVDHEVRVARGYIRHYGFKRAITLEANLEPETTNTVEANRILMAAWDDVKGQFPAVSLDFSGELDDINESLDAMAGLFLLGVGLIYLILAAQFRSYWQPLIVLVTVPLAFTGVVLGLLITGNPMSLYTLYGVIALTGIAVNSSIVLIDAANERMQAGMSVLHASIYAGRRRVVPIFITSATTIGGLFSLAVGLGGKSLMWGPVAASIVWGLGFSTVLTLFAIPVIYRLAMSPRVRLRRPRP